MRNKIILSTFFSLLLLIINSEFAFSQGLVGGGPGYFPTKGTLTVGEGQNFIFAGRDSVPIRGGFNVAGDESTRYFYLALKPSDTAYENISVLLSLYVKISDNIRLESTEIIPAAFSPTSLIPDGITRIRISENLHDDSTYAGHVVKILTLHRGGGPASIRYNPPMHLPEGDERKGFENAMRFGKVHYTLLDDVPGMEAYVELLSKYDNPDAPLLKFDASDRNNVGGGTVRNPDGTLFNLERVQYLSNTKLLALPVELLFFNAEIQNERVHTTWATSNEVDNDYFIVQRSRDVENFEDISEKIQGKGNSSERNDYSYDDEPIESGVYYYRLKQVDFDGNEDFSNIVPVNFVAPEDTDLTEQPLKIVALNMINGQLYVLYNINKTERVTFRIFDIYGNLKEKEYDNPIIGGNAKSMNFGNPSGIYIITATSGKDYDNRKFSIVE